MDAATTNRRRAGVTSRRDDGIENIFFESGEGLKDEVGQSGDFRLATVSAKLE